MSHDSSPTAPEPLTAGKAAQSTNGQEMADEEMAASRTLGKRLRDGATPPSGQPIQQGWPHPELP